ncbi:MAG: uracil-DNA glycosylase [Chromatiales bacterium]|nr:uracil-DNA glycosylase [Chromatiales bacterium]
MEQRRDRYLEAMGITRWVPRQAATESGESISGDADNVPDLDWQALRHRVSECRLCGLHEGRTQAVFGVGDPAADWMIIGEAPGAEEDRVGEPFVGRAGQLLDAMLEGLGLSRQSVYIANVLKCRPPNNRDPSQNEASQCAPYLQRQIRLVAPSVILAVGRVAAQNLLGADGPLGRMRGQIHHYGVHEVPLVVTYHPAYLLRRPAEKAKAWRDLLLAAQVVSGNSR